MKLLITALKKITAEDDYSIYTDESGKFWGNAGAGAIFQAEDTGRYLLPFRSKFVNEPHTWGVWGGAIDEGEDPKQAVKREVKEEAGYTGKFDMKLLNIYEDSGSDFTYHTFLVKVTEEFEPKLDWETEDFGWFAKKEFPKPLHFGLKALMSKLS